MQIRWLFALPLLLLLALAAAADGAQEDVQSVPTCSLCKMSREKHDFSRAVVKFRDGTTRSTCSITCAAVEISRRGEQEVSAILVADYRTRELIDARTAFWVMGGSRRGVMTMHPKWAFSTEEAAQAFIEEFGGRRVTFPEVMAAAYEDTKPKHQH
ncbi:MAG: nitrous oxide reductase accessory protein NosL [Deltaproteobacteria bacterium]|nr:nitrous oxide reductase accessory protein NosL [Deltaproteobacteria bacterium]